MSDGATEMLLQKMYDQDEDGQDIPREVFTDPDDMVNSPAHYTHGNVECIDAIEAAIGGLGGMEGMCTGNAIKYLWRWKWKGGHEDLRKARYYINRLLGDA